MSYYADKIEALQDILGTDDVRLEGDSLRCGAAIYPIIDDVIVLLEAHHLPKRLRQRIQDFNGSDNGAERLFSEHVQTSFSMQWHTFDEVLPEHANEFRLYFDLIDLDGLQSKRCADIGCGIGRWSKFLAPYVRELVLLDFSEAIFVARRNLRDQPHALFFMGDLTAMPFRGNFADLLFSFGVLHHLHQNCLDLTRQMSRYAPEVLIYLYYSLDNRPAYFRLPWQVMNGTRRMLCHIHSDGIRRVVSYGLAFGAYLPFIAMGRVAAWFGQGHRVPLYEFYRDKTLLRIRQDAYDRFFTPLEQRVSRAEILTLSDTYRDIVISTGLPYWHFLCRR
jgi:SAM-dependent methyltransferase